MNQDFGRKYIAFISYRHLPLQMEVAKALHRRIERYTIPKGLRKDGKKKLGYVFRDQDELPIVGSLSDNIQHALDNSEYLIVICTPETSESLWCIKEIEYFLEHHDRDHILAVLADGSPAASFPKEIVEIRDANGNLVSQSEPLAANIVANSSRGRLHRLKSESLRIIAALIGCPYDALFRREQRFKYRRLAAASAAVLCIAASFVGMLLNRNALIQRQLLSTQINESLALASLSRSAYQEGNYNGALEYALQALPSETNQRPYVADAEFALSQSLHLYDNGILAYDQSFEHPTQVYGMVLTENGERLVTTDAYHTVRCYDTYSGSLLWTNEVDSYSTSPRIIAQDRVFVGGSMFRISDGQLLWSRESGIFSFSRNQRFMICYSNESNLYSFDISATENNEIANTIEVSGDIFFNYSSFTVSDDGLYAAFLTHSGKLSIFDTMHGQETAVDEGLSSPVTVDTHIEFLENGDLLVSSSGSTQEQAWVALYTFSSGWEKQFCTSIDVSQNLYYRNGIGLRFGVALLDVSEDKIAFGTGKSLILLDRQTGEIIVNNVLPNHIIDSVFYKNEDNSIGLILSDATITFSSESGMLSSNLGKRSFEGKMTLRLGAMSCSDYRSSVFAMVSESSPSQISIVRWIDKEDITPAFDNIPELKNAMVIPSPSGQKTAVVIYDYKTKELTAAFIDTTQAEPVATCHMPVEHFLTSDRDDIFCTEDGKIISQGYVYDLVENKEYSLSDKAGKELSGTSTYYYVSANHPSDNSVYSAAVSKEYKEAPVLLIWKDTELVKRLSVPVHNNLPLTMCPNYYCCGCGASGCLIVGIRRSSSDTDEKNTGYLCCFPDEERWISLPAIEDNKASSCAVGETKPLMAYVSPEKKLCLANLSDGSVILTFPLDHPVDSISKLLFFDSDSMLLVFSDQGNLQFYDTETGNRLADIEIKNTSTTYVGKSYFTSTGRYAVIPSADGRELLILYCDSSFTRLITLEKESLNCTGVFNNVAHYLPLTNRVMIKQPDTGVFYCPLYSLEDKIVKAQEIISR